MMSNGAFSTLSQWSSCQSGEMGGVGVQSVFQVRIERMRFNNSLKGLRIHTKTHGFALHSIIFFFHLTIVQK